MDVFELDRTAARKAHDDVGTKPSDPERYRLSVVVPAYNEALRFETPLRAIASYLEAQPYEAELIIVDDGSDDRSFEIARSLAQDSRIAVAACGYPRNQGKGFALKVGFELARGDAILFCDADLSTPIEEVSKLLAALDAGADVAIGSRKMPGSTITTHQPRIRESLGKVFTWLVRRSIADVSDVTCGFKAFRRRAGRDLFRLLRLYDWSFDAEILVLAEHKGLVLSEVPVTWQHKPGSKVRLVRDGFRALANLARLQKNLHSGVYREDNRVAPALEEFFNDAWRAESHSSNKQQRRHAG